MATRYFYMGDQYLWSDEVAAIVDFDDLHLMDVVSWNTEHEELANGLLQRPADS